MSSCACQLTLFSQGLQKSTIHLSGLPWLRPLARNNRGATAGPLRNGGGGHSCCASATCTRHVRGVSVACPRITTARRREAACHRTPPRHRRTLGRRGPRTRISRTATTAPGARVRAGGVLPRGGRRWWAATSRLQPPARAAEPRGQVGVPDAILGRRLPRAGIM